MVLRGQGKCYRRKKQADEVVVAQGVACASTACSTRRCPGCRAGWPSPDKTHRLMGGGVGEGCRGIQNQPSCSATAMIRRARCGAAAILPQGNESCCATGRDFRFLATNCLRDVPVGRPPVLTSAGTPSMEDPASGWLAHPAVMMASVAMRRLGQTDLFTTTVCLIRGSVQRSLCNQSAL